jgi:serine/threonine protein kinase
VIHKDIKPGNLLVTTDQILKITDLGVAEVNKIKFDFIFIINPIACCTEPVIRCFRFASPCPKSIELSGMIKSFDWEQNFGQLFHTFSS